MSTAYETRAKIMRVEERYSRTYDPAKMGEAKVESQAEFAQVSTGWWVVLDGWPIAIRMGDAKPDDLAEGDTLSITMRKSHVVGPASPPWLTSAEMLQLVALDKCTAATVHSISNVLMSLHSLGLIAVETLGDTTCRVSITPRGVEAIAGAPRAQ